MENNQRNSRKRLNSLILLVAFTAVMLIVSTYAWFSTQRNVTLSGLKGKVNVAEGLQISLDGAQWVNEIDFDDFDQTTDKTSWTVKDSVVGGASKYFADTSVSPTFQKPLGASGAITNVVPEEFLPVSTTGFKTTTDGINQPLLKMYGGEVANNNSDLNNVAQKAEDPTSGYYAFDIFVWNSSAESVSFDTLKLDANSTVTGDNTGTGIENSARIAFALYNNDGDSVSTDTVRTGAEVIAGTSTGKTIKDIAIWEPNADKHSSAAVLQIAPKIKFSAADLGYFTLESGTSEFAAGEKIPTYALTSASTQISPVEGKGNITNIYDWSGTVTSQVIAATGLGKQYTLQTSATSSNFTESVDLISVNKMETAAASGGVKDPSEVADTKFVLAASQYHKIRVYVWIEGQDPDCINAASLGGGLTIDIGFSKPASTENS